MDIIGTKVWFDLEGRDDNNDSSAMVCGVIVASVADLPDEGDGFTYTVRFNGNDYDTVHSDDITLCGDSLHGGVVDMGG